MPRKMNYNLGVSADMLRLSNTSGFILLFCLLFCLLSCLQVSAQKGQSNAVSQKTDPGMRDLGLFASEEILNATMKLDLGAFTNKPSRNDSFDSEMIIYLNEKDTIDRKIKIKYRGISRYEICNFPPMEIYFKKPIYSDSNRIKKLKLVTHCKWDNINNEYVLREYLVYKLYNALTDTSFRVRLLKISYVDSKNDRKPVVRYGIFIEPLEMLAKRTNCTVVKSKGLNQNNIKPYVMDRVAIFNYMVSNWDWSVPGEHNVEIIKPSGLNPGNLGIAIPYDFDLTGVVNAYYAIPPPALGIDNVRQPVFSGVCRTREVYEADLKRFSVAKEKLYSVVNDFPYLNFRAKKDITTFLDQFFDQLTKPRRINFLIDVFLNNCN